MPKMVVNAEKWQDMDGDSDLIKKLNSYLTCQFVVSRDVPSDECLTPANDILRIFVEYATKGMTRHES